MRQQQKQTSAGVTSIGTWDHPSSHHNETSGRQVVSLLFGSYPSRGVKTFLLGNTRLFEQRLDLRSELCQRR